MRKSRTKPMYVNRSPGLKCQHCGKPIPQRAPGTKYCHECAAIVARERAAMKREREKKLIARDTAKGTIYNATKMGLDSFLCPECAKEVSVFDTFCRYCGQRLKNDEEELNYAFEPGQTASELS